MKRMTPAVALAFLLTGFALQARGMQVGAPTPTVSEFTVRTLNAERNIGASYPRVIQIQHSPAAKGHLLATFSRRGASLPIYRSTDNSDTWQQISEVKGLRGQPSLYELAQRSGSLPAGTILASGNGRTGRHDQVGAHRVRQRRRRQELGIPEHPRRGPASAVRSRATGRDHQAQAGLGTIPVC